MRADMQLLYPGDLVPQECLAALLPPFKMSILE